MATTLGEVFAENRRRFNMARAVGGAPGTTPVGDRPGTTTAASVTSWKGTAAGRARLFALTAFVVFSFVHVAAEARYAD